MKSLRTLQGSSARLALTRLRQAVQDIVPAPEALQPKEPELVDEVRRILKLEDPISPTMPASERAKVLGFLTEAILQYGKKEFDLLGAKNRIAARGALRLRDYEIVMGEALESLALTPTNMEEGIRQADLVQHFSLFSESPEGVAPPFDDVSLFAKRVEGRSRFYLIVVALRKGARLTVADAWRAYFDRVNCELADSPLELLQRFVRVYGITFLIAGRGPMRFVAHDTFPFDASGTVPLMQVLVEPGQQRVRSSIATRLSHLGVLQVAFAYAVDLEMYTRDMRAHGVDR